MKQKLMSSIGGCLLLAFLLLAFPIRGQAADSITVTDDDNGVMEQILSPAVPVWQQLIFQKRANLHG